MTHTVRIYVRTYCHGYTYLAVQLLAFLYVFVDICALGVYTYMHNVRMCMHTCTAL